MSRKSSVKRHKQDKEFIKYPVEQFFSTRNITSFELSSDGKKVLYITNTTGLPQIWSIPVTGGWTQQITLESQAVKNLVPIPNSNDILFFSDFNGNERIQIFKINENGGQVECLTSKYPDSISDFCCFNKKGTKFLWSNNYRNKYNFDIFIRDLKTGDDKLVYKTDDTIPVSPEGWSPDERYISIQLFYGNIDMDISLLDTKTGKIENITKKESGNTEVNYSVRFNKNSTGLYFNSDHKKEFRGLRYYDIKKKEFKWIVNKDAELFPIRFSSDFKYLSYIISKNGSEFPEIIDFKKNKKIKLKLPKGCYSNIRFSKDNKTIFFKLSSPEIPGDIFRYELKSKKLTQLTFSTVGGITKSAFTKPKDVFYKSFDGLKIHSLLYIPKGLKKDGKNPAILWPHGGPEAQELHNFSRWMQVFSNNGYIVIAPNFRGSTGYGKTFQRKIYRDWGGAEFGDILSSLDVLKNSGYVDMEKVAVVGGSFGGFVTLTCITKAPDLWKCAVDIFGPSNLITFVDSVPDHWKAGMYDLVGDAVKDKSLLEERSPINYIDNIKCPLLVIQGKNDPRVVEKESAQIVEKLKQNNKDVEYILFEDEGHGFSKISNQINAFKNIISFLDKHLR